MSANKENVHIAPASEEEEQEMLTKMREAMAVKLGLPTALPTRTAIPTREEQADIDARSIYIGNVDWDSTDKDIEELFKGCGGIKRVTIPKCRLTGRAKGLAYAEFIDLAAKDKALLLDGAVLRGRRVKVAQKRTNVPGMSATGQAPRQPYGRHQQNEQRVVVRYVYQNKPRHFLPHASRKIDNRFKPF